MHGHMNVKFVMSVRPHEKTQLKLDGVSWNLIFESFFSRVGRENSSFVKICQE
jgi:hypothetical protein